MSIAAGPDGKLYAMQNSQQELLGFDEFGWEIYGFGNAQLYTIDPMTKSVEYLGDTGVKSNMIASMTYDYDTDMLYWTPVFREGFFSGISSALIMIDPETAHGYNLGMVGASGASLSGIYAISDNFPTEPDPALLSVIMDPVKADLVAGQSAELKAITIPMTLDAEITWSSSDIEVVTVDENGVITAVSQGNAVITATVSYNGVTITGECQVSVLAEDAAFLTYNVTDGGWAEISRANAEIVTNLTEGEAVDVAAFADVKGDIYGYDVENNLFKLDTATYERDIIGQIDSESLIEDLLISYGYGEDEIPDVISEFAFEVRDMDYDAANDRLLILGNIYDVMWGELNGGNGIYAVNLTEGTVECLYTFDSHYYVMAMTVDPEGTVYFYNAYDDTYATLDLETGAYKDIISLQSQSYYGSTEDNHALYYDAITGKLYHLFTSNGFYYGMFSVDLITGAITHESEYIGEVAYDPDMWVDVGDRFAGLSFINKDAGSGMPEVPVMPEYSVEWVSANTSLGGNIGLNFYAKMSVDLVNEPSTIVRFTYDGKTVDVPMNEAVISMLDGETRYRFTCRLNSKQMTDMVTAQVMTAEGPVGEPATTSIAAYCNYIIANSDDTADAVLMKAMLNYGSAAQVLFDYKTDGLANAEMDDADKVLADVDASEWKHSITGSDEGIKLTSAVLVLESETSIRIYFTLTGEKSIEEFIFTVDGEEVTPVEKNGTYYVAYENIAAHELGDMHEFCIGGYTVTYAGLSYVNQVLSSGITDSATIDLAKALFAYCQAALAYIPG